MNMFNFRLTISQLMLSNIYLGDNFAFVNIKIKPFLLGYKNGYHLINLSFTQIQFKIVLKVIINLIINRQKILIVKNNDFYNLNYYFNNKNVFFYIKKWIGGLLTNFRLVRKNKIFASKELLAVNNINFLRYMPSLIFIFDTKISKWPLFEAYNLEIPTSSIINSSSLYIDFINYPVIGNNKSFEAIYLYVNFIRNAIMKGKQKERLKILRIL